MLFQELGKLKRSSIMTSIVLMAVAVVMMICPEKYIPVQVATLGYALLVFSTVLILDFISSPKVLINYVSFTGALVLGILGASVTIFNDDVVRFIGVVFGLGQIVFGIIDICHTLIYVRRAQRKTWRFLIVLNALTICFGLIVLINPWWKTTGRLFDVIGCMLLFSSMVGIVRLIYIWPIKSEYQEEK